jgi:hypothetical protein
MVLLIFTNRSLFPAGWPEIIFNKKTGGRKLPPAIKSKAI